jgi:hypothetical protein
MLGDFIIFRSTILQTKNLINPIDFIIDFLGGDPMLVRIGIMRALNWPVERVFNTDRKERHGGRRELGWDR